MDLKEIGAYNARHGQQFSELQRKTFIRPGMGYPLEKQIEDLQSGFRSYISLRKREIRKKINRVFLIMTRLDYDKKRKLISHKVYSTSRIRLIMIGHKYQEQLCNLNKQLTS